jgi:hypothetical protein
MIAKRLAVTFVLVGTILFASPVCADTHALARLSIPSLRLFDVPVVTLPIQSGRWAEERLEAREVGLLETTGRWPSDAWAMVLAGHVTLEDEQRGPFYGLGSLQPGQILLLYDIRQGWPAVALSGGWPAVARSRRRESHLSARWPPAATDDLRGLG